MTQPIEVLSSWECTRLVISPEVTAASDRNQCLDIIVGGLIEMAEKAGAKTLISLSNLWLLRSLRKLGYNAELLGNPYVNKEDGHKYAVMAIDALPSFAVQSPAPYPKSGAEIYSAA